MLTPRWYQTEANACVWQYFKQHPGENPVVVLPTGAGKSLSIAMLIKQATDFGGRVLVLAHRKELLRQNADEIMEQIPNADVGIHSAGMKSRDVENQIIVAGIQTVFKKANLLGRRHLVIVDECHLISEQEESMYGILIGEMRLQKGTRIVGLTATPFRTGTGSICGPEKLFRDIVFEAKTGRLIEEGWLSSITNKKAETIVNLDKVGIRAGEFFEADLQSAFGGADVTTQACREIVASCFDRHSILAFCCGVNHAQNVADEIAYLTNERVGVVIGDTPSLERSAFLEDFKNQQLRWLVNCDVLTTGFNARCIDAIAVLRATLSPGLFAQMLGRGLRTHESKPNGCLILDFGKNIARHGSIDDDNYGYAKKEMREKGDAAVAANGRGKKCDVCSLDVAPNTRVCPGCGYEFPVRHEATADNKSTVVGKAPPEDWIVSEVYVKRHEKKSTPDYPDPPPTLRVDYVCNRKPDPKAEITSATGNLSRKTISEWLCPEHEGFASTKFKAWWNTRSIMDPPDSVNDAVYLIGIGACRHPVEITTVADGKYTKIKKYNFGNIQMPIKLKEPDAPAQSFSGYDDDVPF